MIRVLPPEVFNRIAAGEVVDRPYSVVKELVENALDSGASEIEIHIEGGGKKKIEVRDNGCGIEESDLKAAFLPHATSKLTSFEDLFSLKTLGFRGEALASIASVSKMKISSSQGGEGRALCSLFGVLGEIEPSSSAKGTCVEVEDLFLNTPARLKFLKSDASEEADVTNLVGRILLSRPSVAFRYYTNGKLRYRTFGDDLKSALFCVYGKEVLNHIKEIDAAKHGLRLFGYLGEPEFSKPNRSYQSLFLNGRYIVNQTISSSIQNAYSSYLMKRQYPFYVLFLDVPPEIVDVNVHPNKADVRFADNQVIYGTVYSIVSSVLDGNARALEYTIPSPPENRQIKFTAEEKREETLEMSYEEAKKELEFEIPNLETGPKFVREEKEEGQIELHSPEPYAQSAYEENKRLLNSIVQEKIDPKELRYKGELFETYLIFERGEEAYLIDQHAAHERMLYDKLKARLEKAQPLSQPLLLPEVIPFSPLEYGFLEKNLEHLLSFGFEIEPFGAGSFKISAVPFDLYGMDVKAFLFEVLSCSESLKQIKLSELLKDRLAQMACKAAVKGGETLTTEEALSLLKEMDGDMGLKCPHGRPVCAVIKKKELEKLFKRIV